MSTLTASSLRATARRSQPLARLCRPANIRKSALLLAGSGLYLGAGAAQVTLGLVMLVLVYGVATIYNDLHDVEIDRANHRDLPLATGQVHPAEARRLVAALLVALAALQPWAVQPAGALFAVTFLALSWAYSAPAVALERRGLAGTVVLAACYVDLPLAYGHLLAGARPRALTLVAAGLLGATALLHKDAKDEHGDRRHGKRTPLVRHGPAWVRRASLLCFAAGAAIALADTRRPVLTGALVALAGLAILRLGPRGEPHLRGYHPAACAAVLSAL